MVLAAILGLLQPCQAHASATTDMEWLTRTAARNDVALYAPKTVYWTFTSAAEVNSRTRFLDVAQCSSLSLQYDSDTAGSPGTTSVVAIYQCVDNGTFANVCNPFLVDANADGVPDTALTLSGTKSNYSGIQIAGWLVALVSTVAASGDAPRLNVTCHN